MVMGDTTVTDDVAATVSVRVGLLSSEVDSIVDSVTISFMITPGETIATFSTSIISLQQISSALWFNNIETYLEAKHADQKAQLRCCYSPYLTGPLTICCHMTLVAILQLSSLVPRVRG